MVFLAAAVSVAVSACGDDDDSDDGRTGGAGGKGGSAGKGGTAGSTSSGGEGGDATSSGGASSGGEGGEAPTSGGAGGEGPGGGGNEGGSGGAVECPIEDGDYGALGSVVGTASSNAEGIGWTWPLENGNPADSLYIELYSGTGLFEEGIVEGTFQLTGDELSYETCSLCVGINVDYDTDNDDFAADYLATGGSVTLTSVEGNLTGTLNNVTFQHVEIDYGNDYVTTPVGDGCEASITSLSFDAEISEE
jgi:hypothetical protein